MKNARQSTVRSATSGTSVASSNGGSTHSANKSNATPKITTEKAKIPSRKISVPEKISGARLFGSQDSLYSVRRKVSVPSRFHAPSVPAAVKSKGSSKSLNKENIHSLKSSLGVHKVGGRSTSNMKPSSSKDSLDSNGPKEKDCSKTTSHTRGTTDKEKTNASTTILQLEREKSVLEQQISELVRNAESKKAEIATLKMEINRMKENQDDRSNDHLWQQLEGLQAENRGLKERLVEMGAPIEQTALSDNEKEQLLLRRSASGSIASLDSERKEINQQIKTIECPSCEAEGGESSGMSLPQSRLLQEWDKASSSSLSEMSVACLQDRIMQMEETHYSTNEELQATLQELADLQDQLTDLQLDNERIGEEKAVLLESLCSQTEKLEECRSQVVHLKSLLFQQFDEDGELSQNSSSKERHWADLLKNAHEEHKAMLRKQEELTSTLQMCKNEAFEHQRDMIVLGERVSLLQSTVESLHADKRMLESQLNQSQEQLSSNKIEISQLKLQLESEQQKVQELQRERDASATSELDNLLQDARKDKERVEAQAIRLQEQLAISQHEVERLKDQLSQLQEEFMVSKNNAKKQVSDLEYKMEQFEAEKIKSSREIELLEDTLHQCEIKCQRHLEDKRELKATIGDLQKSLNEVTAQLKDSQQELNDLKMRHDNETDEWKKFQADLLTTVRVANDFKNEAQNDVERLISENKNLRQRLETLQTDLEKMKVKQESLSPTQHRVSSTFIPPSSSFPGSDVAVLSSVERDLASARKQLGTNKWNEYGGGTQLSVRTLIESIESATKQVKGQGACSSRSSSTSSLNGVASDNRSCSSALILGNAGDIFIKPSAKSTASDGTSLIQEKAAVQNARLSRGPYPDSSSCNKASSPHSVLPSETGSSPNNRSSSETGSGKPLVPHPVSILANKLEPMRRNSYGFCLHSDIVEKKDPLAALVKGGGSKRNALLKWCQNKTMGYKNIDITNFSSSWNDGLAFCALLHTYLPDLIPYEELDNKDKRRNFSIAFQAAESVGISSTLSINELISLERPDWQSIMSYVTSIYKHFET